MCEFLACLITLISHGTYRWVVTLINTIPASVNAHSKSQKGRWVSDSSDWLLPPAVHLQTWVQYGYTAQQRATDSESRLGFFNFSVSFPFVSPLD